MEMKTIKRMMLLVGFVFMILFATPLADAQTERIHDEDQFRMVIEFEFNDGYKTSDTSNVVRYFDWVTITTHVEFSDAARQEFENSPSFLRSFNRTIVINDDVVDEVSSSGLYGSYDHYTRNEVINLDNVLEIEVSAEIYWYNSDFIYYDTTSTVLTLSAPDNTGVLLVLLAFLSAIIVIVGCSLVARKPDKSKRGLIHNLRKKIERPSEDRAIQQSPYKKPIDSSSKPTMESRTATDMKDMRFCPYCGSENQIPDAQFCSRCGRPRET